MKDHWTKEPIIRAAMKGYYCIDLNQREKEVRFPYAEEMVIQLQAEAQRQNEADIAWDPSSCSMEACGPVT